MFEGFESKRIAAGEVEINARVGGSGPPLLLLHGYPENHLMWHKVAPRLAQDFSVVCTDLRGYGDSAKPAGGQDHAEYSKRAMARDQVEVMAALGHERFMVAGHDRGGRVGHRMALDHPEQVERLAVLDIVPTLKLYESTDQAFATVYFHWFFLIQQAGFPEHFISKDPEFWVRAVLGRFGAADETYPDEVIADYVRCFSDPATIHATCEDYRAAAAIDLDHDRADLERKIACPVLALWGGTGAMEPLFDVLETWAERADNVTGRALDCGHFMPEEAPDQVYAELHGFFIGKGS